MYSLLQKPQITIALLTPELYGVMASPREVPNFVPQQHPRALACLPPIDGNAHRALMIEKRGIHGFNCVRFCSSLKNNSKNNRDP
jgi:hypothetical protein